MTLLEVDGLAVNFGGIRAVDGVSFAVEPGQVFTIIGPNGAGKTTIFKPRLADLRPDPGPADLL